MPNPHALFFMEHGLSYTNTGVGCFETDGNLDYFPKLYYYFETEKFVVVAINSKCWFPRRESERGDVLVDIL